jgi:hypothetical protein
MKKIKIMIAIVSLLMLSGACWSEDLETNTNEVKYYDNAKVVRIKSVEGEAFVQRSYEEGNEEATANLPLFEKDSVGTSDGRLGIYLGRLNYLRLDADSVVVLEKIPQLRKTDLSVRLEQGSLYLDIESLDNEKGIEIQTPDCGIFLLDKGIYRVNVTKDRLSEIYVMEGIAEVAGKESSRNVRENQKIVMANGEIKERPYYFYASEKDDFDRWNEAQNRESGYARYGTSRYLQSGYEDTEYEMSRSGRWSYMSDFNSYAWVPYNTNSDWMPYANGRWVWNPYYGYVWTSYDTCGWFTHHYGRWQWDYSMGWYWIPSYHWSPAWVSWFGNDHYYGWCPLSWWNRPVIVINNRWDRNYDYRHGMPRNSRSTIIIRKNELSSANMQRVALNRNTLGQDADKVIAYRGSAPIERPIVGKVAVINARGKTETFKQGSIVNSEKYRAQGSDVHATVNKNDPASRTKDTIRRDNDEDGTYFRSRSSRDASSSSRTRYSPSNSSDKKSSETSSSRSNSGGSDKIDSPSSSSSSSSSRSSTPAKKKKGEASTLSRSSGENSNNGKETAAPYARYQSQSSFDNGGSSRFSNRASASRYESRSSSGESAVVAPRYRAESRQSNDTESSAARRYLNNRNAASSNSENSAPIYNYRSSRSSSYDSGSRSTLRYNAPVTSSSREYRNSSSSGTNSPSMSRSSSSSGSSSSSSSSNSRAARSSSSTSSGTAKEKK